VLISQFLAISHSWKNIFEGLNISSLDMCISANCISARAVFHLCAFTGAKHNNKGHFTRCKCNTTYSAVVNFWRRFSNAQGILFFHLIAKWRARVATPLTDKLFAVAGVKKELRQWRPFQLSLTCNQGLARESFSHRPLARFSLLCHIVWMVKIISPFIANWKSFVWSLYEIQDNCYFINV